MEFIKSNSVALIALLSAQIVVAAQNGVSSHSDNASSSSSSNGFIQSVQSGNQPSFLQFESAEGHVFMIDENLAKQSGTIAAMFAPEVKKMLLGTGRPIQFNEISTPALEVLYGEQLCYGSAPYIIICFRYPITYSCNNCAQ